MFFNWRGIAIVLVVLAGVILLCTVDLRCSGGASQDSTLARIKGELTEGKKEMRYQKAEELAALARDFRALAAHYLKQGQKRKAQRAISTAQQLDRRIRELRKSDVSDLESKNDPPTSH